MNLEDTISDGFIDFEARDISKLQHDGLLFERENIPVGESTVIVVVRFNCNSELKDHLIDQNNFNSLDREIKGIRNLATIVSVDREIQAQFFDTEILSRRGNAAFAGSYGFLCGDRQSFSRRCITYQEGEDIAWRAFGICPHSWSIFYQNGTCGN